ncbi:hypothetical protein OHC51_12965 [Stenotrophomonas indicatrix]|uniref:DUF6624 domain-containing protein n=1 Tax=Stenotrophomonas indicatrix TaxID=2045451 RepID=UPI00300A086D
MRDVTSAMNISDSREQAMLPRTSLLIRRTLISLSLVLCLGAHAHIASAHEGQQDFFAALDYYGEDDYENCSSTLEKLYLSNGTIPEGGHLLLVECTAAAGRLDDSLRYATELSRQGRVDLIELKTKDRPGLQRLRASDRWKGVIESIESERAAASERIDTELRRQLLEREAADQDARKRFTLGADQATRRAVDIVDESNTAWLKSIVLSRGWPGKSLVGREAAKAAWVLVQHADREPDFQRLALAEMEKVGSSEVDPADVAFLTDRVLLASGKKQRFGTQFKTFGDRIELEPTEDMPGLADRRTKAGLPPIEEYRKMLLDAYSSRDGK